MKKYTARIVLCVNEFQVLDEQEATQAVDRYIDHLIEVTEVSAGELTWDNVDYSLEEN
jgi:hypothetical protein